MENYEEKDLLLKDLCARLPFRKTICKIGEHSDYILSGIDLSNESQPLIIELDKEQFPVCLEHLKPYLRPLSSMTKEEINEFILISDTVLWLGDKRCPCILSLEQMDWLNEHHFDYRGLIEKGLALEAPKDMYNTKTE